MKFNLPKGLANMFRSAAKLDPSAKPFFPHEGEGGAGIMSTKAEATNPNFAIYNDGVPSLTPTSLKDVFDGISDEAIDENFAPDAQEAAELEIIDHYVQELAKMDILEDREERARKGFNHIRKRWETRRAHGIAPNESPRKPLNSVVPESHLEDNGVGVAVTSIQPFSHYRSHFAKSELNKKSRLALSSHKSSRMAKSRIHQPGHKLIQQPRKFY